MSINRQLENIGEHGYIWRNFDAFAMTEEMDELEKRMVRIAEIASKLPEKFQQRAFEFLLNSLVSQVPKSPLEAQITEKKDAKIVSPKEFTMPIDVRAFLQQYSVPEESLLKLFYSHGAEIRGTFKIRTTKKATAQLQISELTALQNALLGGKFEFSYGVVREECKEHKCYDTANFAKTFKNNPGFFKSLSDEEHVELSPDGKAALAETILELAK